MKFMTTDSYFAFLLAALALVSGPTVTVLFGALIPPFIPAGADVVHMTLILGATFMVIAAIGDTAYALAAGRAGAWLSRSRIRAIVVISDSFLVVGAAWMVLKGR